MGVSWLGKGPSPGTVPKAPAGMVHELRIRKPQERGLVGEPRKVICRGGNHLLTVFFCPGAGDLERRVLLQGQFDCPLQIEFLRLGPAPAPHSAEAPPQRPATTVEAAGFFRRDLTMVKSTGTTRSVKNMEQTNPTAITLARGLQRLDPGEDHGGDPHRGGHGRQKDGTQTALARLRRSLLQRVSLLDLLVQIVHQDDGVPHDDPAKADHPHQRRESKRIPG